MKKIGLEGPGVRIDTKGLQGLAMRFLLPGLLLNLTVANQLWTIGPVYVGQLILWPLIACSSLIVILTFPRSIWPVLLVVALVVARIVGANSASGVGYLVYGIPLHTLFVMSGAITAARCYDRVYRQLRLYFIITLPMMILQMAGAGNWTLALNTETTAVSLDRIEQARVVSPTLFVSNLSDGARQPAIGQRRPAGFMHANNMLSIAIIFGIALQFARIYSRRVTWTDALYCTVMVLSGAKIVMLSFLIMIGWLGWTGSLIIRRRIVSISALVICILASYFLFFPGVFAHVFSSEILGVSVFSRVGEIVRIFLGDGGTGIAFLQDILATSAQGEYQMMLTQVSSVEETLGALSGYVGLLRALPYLIAPGMVFAWLFRRGLLKVQHHSPIMMRLAVLSFMVVALVPAAIASAWQSHLYWFIVGFACFPLLPVISNSFNESIDLRPISSRKISISRGFPRPA